ncbi:MAG: BlaI/MecI/CopY family transcriptional regulator [Verrucomicrobiaceae bacterium]|nr:MAG: BlaI/MecI/CopY family transcriptional regulator [Verrucomicrobiaceae bacterium]
MSMPSPDQGLSRRERQIMDVIYARGEATAADVNAALPNPPSYSAVRALLRILEEKGVLQHREDGPRYIYLPVIPREKASRSALKGVVQTFFAGSLADAVAAFVDAESEDVSPEELKRLEAVIKAAKSRNKANPQ